MLPEVFAVFVAKDWLDTDKLRLWVKRLPHGVFVLLTDENTESNVVLIRQLRCDCITYALVATPGRLRSRANYEAAIIARDEVMAAVAKHVVDFGELPGGPGRFHNHVAIVFQSTL